MPFLLIVAAAIIGTNRRIKLANKIIVGFETYATDNMAGIAGGTFGAVGAGVGGPIGAGLGYLAGNVLGTRIGDRLSANANKKYKLFGDWP